jgi:hypothetical protein
MKTCESGSSLAHKFPVYNSNNSNSNNNNNNNNNNNIKHALLQKYYYLDFRTSVLEWKIVMEDGGILL